MIVLTNVPQFPRKWTAYNGERGESLIDSNLFGFLGKVRRSDCVLINCDPSLLMQLAAAFALLPMYRRPLFAADTVLRAPQGVFGKSSILLKRLLLRRVDHFMHSFRDLSGYKEFFGVGPEQSSFVPFKPNLRYHCTLPPNPDGQYVLCFGQSMRDFDTFFAAVERFPYPAAIVEPDFRRLRLHGSRFTRKLSDLPENVRILPHDPKNQNSQAEVLSNAKLVVVPLLKDCLVQTGTAYNAMLLGKCVILTRGPATNGIFSNEVLTAPAESPEALAEVIHAAWTNNDLRIGTAAAGYRCVLDLGGEPELYQRLIDRVIRVMHHEPIPRDYECFAY